MWDPGLVSDALFAIANVISVCRMTYLLAVSERLGPLIISLARMIMVSHSYLILTVSLVNISEFALNLQDVFAFMIIFLLVIIAFMVGFRNLYWYYNEEVRVVAEINGVVGVDEDSATPAETSFGGFQRIIRTVFWSIFGMADYDAVELGVYGSSITSIVGEILFGIYNWIMIIILINMLIAMMARSYETIAVSINWTLGSSIQLCMTSG